MMNEKAEEMRAKMKALQFPDDALSNVSGSSPGSWSGRNRFNEAPFWPKTFPVIIDQLPYKNCRPVSI
jgi:hypothetical protein